MGQKETGSARRSRTGGVMKKNLLVVILVFSLVACYSSPQPSSYSSSSISNSPPQEPRQSSGESGANLLCRNTNNYIGDYVTCKISRAYCSYQPNVSGSPTFCNDAPYPNHDFTYVIWDRDFSSLDGQCLLVSGYVSVYKGKSQIESENNPNFSYCQ